MTPKEKEMFLLTRRVIELERLTKKIRELEQKITNQKIANQNDKNTVWTAIESLRRDVEGIIEAQQEQNNLSLSKPTTFKWPWSR